MHGYALAPHTTPTHYDILELDAQFAASTIADICDRETLVAAMQQAQPDIVMHLAAQAIVGEAHRNAFNTWQVNTLGTVALMEAMQQVSAIRAAVIFTTDKVYDNPSHHTSTHFHAFTETDAVGGYGLYDSSKGAAELAVRAYQHGGLAPAGTATIRAGNVIGGGDWNEARLIPDCVRAWAQGEPVILRHPDSVRPWQHVLDVCYATLMLAEALYTNPTDYSGAWNIGPEEDAVLTARAVTEMLAKAMEVNTGWHADAHISSYPEAALLALDSTKFKKALCWQPVLTAQEAIIWTGNWYRCSAEKSDKHILTHEQMATFAAKTSQHT